MTITKSWLGIDPGQSGAACLLPVDGNPELFDWPGDLSLCADQLRTWRLAYRIELAALEHVHAFKGQGVSSTFTFGANFGQWAGLLAGLGIPYLLVKPKAWQSGLFSKADGLDAKTRSLTVARRLWPDLELHLAKHHGRADSLHLASYARRWATGKG